MKTHSRKKKSCKTSKKQTYGRLFKYTVILFLAFAMAGFLLTFSVYTGLWGKLPDYAELRHIRNDEASELHSEDGEVIGKYYIKNRTNVNYGNIPEYAVKALIATEDARFYQHEGIDKISMLRVFFKTLLLGDRSSGGGSTLSQQLAKNLFPRDEQQVTFMPIIKLKEMFTARRLENIYTKDEILTLYLNTVSFGEDVFGIESAAQKYFSVTASDLTIPQSATLIGMLKGPTRYNPRLHPERARQRRNTVINQMVKYDFLNEEQAEQLKEEELVLEYKPTNHYSGLAPYLREKIRRDAIQIIDDYNARYGTHYNLYKDGLVLTTTLDAEMQRFAEEAVAIHMKQLQESYYTHLAGKEPWDAHPSILQNAIRNSQVYQYLKANGKSEEEIKKIMNEKKPMIIYSPSQGEARVEYSSVDSLKHYLKIFHPAVLAVEPQTGKIKAWVGGLDYKYFQYDQVEAARQMGSVFKPVVYSAAIHHGARLDAYYPNELKTYAEYDNWTPRNSDNKYEGFYTLKGALSKSINTIAVDVLLQTGIDTVINHARRLGITSDLPPYPSLALGVANLSLQEMINPFLCFADNGRLVPQYYLSEIRDREGNILFKAVPKAATEALPAHEAHLMSNILASVINEGTGQRLRSTYGLTNELAGKTGTTQNQVDGWFIGYNPKIVIGVRVGANDVNIHFNSIRLGQGASMALPIFGELMHRCVDSYTYENWNNLTFPVILPHDEKRMDIPEFKEQLNIIDKLTNRKLEKTEYPDLQEKKKERKEGFFKRLFGKKNQ